MRKATGCIKLLFCFVLGVGLMVLVDGCDKAEDVGRKVMHKSGDLVGKGATEFFSGVGEGVDAVKWKGPDVLTAISTRKSIRKFDATKPVEDDKVEKMLRAAMCAPTAMDKRPWEFVVVKDPAKLSALAARLPYSRVGNGAKLAIVVCGSLDNGLPGRGKEYWIHDCSAATMNLLLAAHAQGLGAVWTGVFPGEDRIAAVREILSIPDGYMPLNVIPVGYPAENPPAKDKWNPAKIHYDKW